MSRTFLKHMLLLVLSSVQSWVLLGTEMNFPASLFQLQAWWRGTVVRREIGSFKMPKKEKDDSKDAKGKEKDKRRGKK